MMPEQKQRIEQIENGDQPWRKTAYELGDVLAGHESDIDFLLSLVKSQEVGCSLCGGPHDFDTSIPSVVWNKVIRTRNLPDYLCTTCIVREFVRAGESFTATLWNEEFYGIPIEVVVNGQNARDTAAIQEENNSLRAELHSSAEAIVNEADKVARLIDHATTSMRSRCVEKLKERASRYQKLADDSLPNDQTAARTAAAAAALNSAAKELESVSIHDQEPKQP